MIEEEFADWLLTRFAQEVIDAVKSPSDATDEVLRCLNNLPATWNTQLLRRVQDLPR